MQRKWLVVIGVFAWVFLLLTGGVLAEVTLEVWNSDVNMTTLEWYRTVLVPAFEAEHPGVKVQIVQTPWGAALTEKIAVSYAGGVGPDIIYGGAEFVDGYVENGFVVSIDKYVKSWKDWSDYLPPALPAVTYKGQVYGVPMSLDYRTVVFSKQVFLKGGVNPNTPPRTWDEFTTLAKKLTKRNGSQVEVAGFSVSGRWYQAYNQMVWQNGGDILNSTKTAPAFNTPEGLNALTYWVNALRETTDGVNRTGGQPIINGTTAMDFQQAPLGIALAIKNIGQNVEEVLGIAPALRQQIAQSAIHCNWMGIGSQSKHPDLAWEFLKFHASFDNYMAYVTSQVALPTRMSALRSTYVKTNPWLTTLINYASEYGRATWSVNEFARLRDAIDPELQKAFEGKISPAEALNNASKAWTQIFSERRK